MNAEGLSDYIIGTLKEYDLDPALIVSQGYDGASVMSGSCSGVQQRIKMIAPNATYVHCYAHCLNLALVDCVHNVQDASEFLNQACTWFLKIDMVRTSVCVCVCECPPPRLLKTIHVK